MLFYHNFKIDFLINFEFEQLFFCSLATCFISIENFFSYFLVEIFSHCYSLKNNYFVILLIHFIPAYLWLLFLFPNGGF